MTENKRPKGDLRYVKGNERNVLLTDSHDFLINGCTIQLIIIKKDAVYSIII